MALQSTAALANITLQSISSEITFSGIPATYRDLVLVMRPIGSGSANDSLYLKFNGSTSDFTWVQMYGNGSSTGSNTGTSGRITNYFNSTARPYTSLVRLVDYSSTDKHKSYISRFGADDAGVGAFAGRWAQTTAVNSISIYSYAGTFAIGSSFSLYGVVA